MHMSITAVLCLLCLSLSGCYLDINIVGEGQVTSLRQKIDCTQNCRKNSIGHLSNDYLEGTPAAGYQFLGFVGNGSGWYPEPGAYLPFVVYGIGWSPAGYEGGAPQFAQRTIHVTAIFWPEDDIKETRRTSNSLCLIDQTSRLHCWGKNANKLPADNVTTLVVDTGTSPGDNLCAIYNDGLQCWNEYYGKDWAIPDFITRPLEVAVLGQSLCILYETPNGNAVHCLAQLGAESTPIPPLSNPVDLRMDNAGVKCVEDLGATVCWGGEYNGQSKVPADLGPVSAFATGDSHTCAIASAKVRCWGNNGQGQLNVPDDLIAPSAISAGANHTCVQDSGQIRCWGGLTARLDLLNPDAFNPKLLASRDDFMCVAGVEQDNRTLCISATSRFVSPPLPDTSAIAIQYTSQSISLRVAAISGDNLYFWSDIGDTLSQPLPLANPTLLTTSYYLICAVDTAGFRCWEPLWNGTFDPRETNIPEGLQPDSMRLTDSGGCAVQNGAVQCWGFSGRGQLDVPANLPAMSQVDMGLVHTCALAQDQQLFCWGETPLPDA